MSSKICGGCGVDKDLSGFYKHHRMADGPLNHCKIYVRLRVRKNRRERSEQYAGYERSRANLPHREEARRKYQEEHTVQLTEYKDKWAANNMELVAASKLDYCERKREEIIARSKKWAEDNPEKVRERRPTIVVRGELRDTPAVETLPFWSSRNCAGVKATSVWLAAIRRPHWRLTM